MKSQVDSADPGGMGESGRKAAPSDRPLPGRSKDRAGKSLEPP